MGLKIAILTPTRHPVGGVETVNQQLIPALSPHQVTLITLDNATIKPWKKKLLGMPAFMKDQLKGTFDIILCNGEYGWNIHHPRAINLFHGTYFGYLEALSPYLSTKERMRLRRDAWVQKISARNKHVVAVSNRVKTTLNLQGISVNDVIENGVDCDFFCPDLTAGPNNKCLFVGSSQYYGKGIDMLESLQEKGLTIDCVSASRPSPKLGWIPFKNPQELKKLYQQYSLLIFPSRFEGQGLVPLEAMASGLPIVMANVGFADHLFQEIPEFVVQNRDPHLFYERVQEVLKEKEKFSKQAVDFVRTFYPIEKFTKQWKELFERKMGSPSSSQQEIAATR